MIGIANRPEIRPEEDAVPHMPAETYPRARRWFARFVAQVLRLLASPWFDPQLLRGRHFDTSLRGWRYDPSDPSRHLPGKSIVLGRCCWLGMNAVILPGVTLGDHTVVGANAVVTKSFPEGYCTLAGNPARVVARRPRPGESPDAEKEGSTPSEPHPQSFPS